MSESEPCGYLGRSAPGYSSPSVCKGPEAGVWCVGGAARGSVWLKQSECNRELMRSGGGGQAGQGGPRDVAGEGEVLVPGLGAYLNSSYIPSSLTLPYGSPRVDALQLLTAWGLKLGAKLS